MFAESRTVFIYMFIANFVRSTSNVVFVREGDLAVGITCKKVPIIACFWGSIVEARVGGPPGHRRSVGVPHCRSSTTAVQGEFCLKKHSAFRWKYKTTRVLRNLAVILAIFPMPPTAVENSKGLFRIFFVFLNE